MKTASEANPHAGGSEESAVVRAKQGGAAQHRYLKKMETLSQEAI